MWHWVDDPPVSLQLCSPPEISPSTLVGRFHPFSVGANSKVAGGHSQWHGLLLQRPHPEETAAESANDGSFEPWKKVLETQGAWGELLRNQPFGLAML